MLHRLIRRFPLWIALTLVVAVVAACGGGGGTEGGSDAPTTTAPAPDAVISFNPGSGADAVSPLAPVTVDVAEGTLESVTMTNDAGEPIEGVLTPDKIGWKPSVPLGYGRTYSIAVSAVNADNKPVQQTSTFTTVTPGNQTLPIRVFSYLEYTSDPMIAAISTTFTLLTLVIGLPLYFALMPQTLRSRT